MLVAAGLSESEVPPGPSVGIGLSLLIAIAALVLALWNPPWWGPPWYRAEKASGEPLEPDLSDPLTAIAHAAVSDAGRSRSETARRFAGQEPLARWNATLVSGGSEQARSHALASENSIGGKLEVYPTGIAFTAHGLEDRVREDPVAIAISRNQLRSVRTISPKYEKGAERGSSMFPRLVLEADGGTYAFNVFFPRRKAVIIEETLRNSGR
jgi:hypothetical protein